MRKFAEVDRGDLVFRIDGSKGLNLRFLVPGSGHTAALCELIDRQIV
jgi:hypothetical protein